MANEPTKEEILRKIADTKREDFDGHTDFQSLTPKQKLQWLSSTAYFVYTAAKNNPKLGCAKLFD
ncbi:MAG: hypothetical protein GY866_40200 [Proteobacteria bacterium]|nr:hypothetical protein [Pseudomonadota bacterium]